MIQFETPENIQVAYEPAGLGTRFVAWFVDNIIMTILGFVLFFVLLCTGAISDTVVRDIARQGGSGPVSPDEAPEVTLYLIGLFLLISGVGSFVYYGLSELFSRGQTIGKRMSGIRVVRLDGFALEPGGIFVRNIFRVVDHLPPLWIVPLLSKQSQRLGDMAAGTVVVFDKPETLGDLRLSLSERPPAEARFTFDSSALKRVRPQDFSAIEQILERWGQLTEDQQQTFLGQLVPPLVARLQTETPADDLRLAFLQDLLAAEYRRQHRSLG
jgi:uncharacterized RDD family membrane protein YckC